MEERDLLGRLAGENASVGGRARIGQLRTAGGRQGDGISVTVGVTERYKVIDARPSDSRPLWRPGS